MASAKWTGRFGGTRPKRVLLLAIAIPIAILAVGGIAAYTLQNVLPPSLQHNRTVAKEYAGNVVSGSATLAVRLFVELPYGAPPSARLVVGDATVPLASVTFDEPGCTMTATGAGQANNQVVRYALEGHPTEGHFDGTLRRDIDATSLSLFLPRVGRNGTGC
ncbi:MAG TPA: hypothetical protein VHG53_02420 [Candidatus Limnocylindria bacterium]|nr:hypothetical protein [Candidatus Limnocylindria bacterium]